GDAGDERAVDLQDVDREALEVAQRRVAGPEVVDREMDAERPQLRQPADRAGGSLHEAALGDLEDEARRRQPGVLDGLLDRLDEVRLLELAGREVDADLQRRQPETELPLAGLATRLAQDPLAHRRCRRSPRQ